MNRNYAILAAMSSFVLLASGLPVDLERQKREGFGTLSGAALGAVGGGLVGGPVGAVGGAALGGFAGHELHKVNNPNTAVVVNDGTARMKRETEEDVVSEDRVKRGTGTGAVIGAIGGGLVGGPLGAAAGAVVGGIAGHELKKFNQPNVVVMPSNAVSASAVPAGAAVPVSSSGSAGAVVPVTAG